MNYSRRGTKTPSQLNLFSPPELSTMIAPDDPAPEDGELSPQARAVLTAFQVTQPAPLHLDLACLFAADPVALRRLQGLTFDPYLLDLLGFAEVRRRLSRRFFKAYRRRSALEEPLWWATMNLNRALQTSCIEVRRVDSVKQLLRLGEHAKQLLTSAGISLLPP